ncbi:deoxyribose-phosphate aldolase [Anaerosphaera aminiphila DSM 21120]|uniref:Deoxyribose-phosphate aldolase n=1 Tax=Anaerosphaera aminiphila DSM 21120 TaxID=1120995 RepID=A0A1M5P2B3_9FIRM|nr:deoxyribose-phosphate aldolase [Anaerosphaera aminiphila]SHG95855.1 deoxyribose-phosphate aldolase [Anaerosphaera aminiphila DSM 21120]
MEINRVIDHTLLKPEASRVQIKKLCEEALKYNFKSVCINPYWVSYAKEILKNTEVLVCTVVGFPLGANTTALKAFETNEAVKNGADEIDMVINIGLLKNGELNLVKSDISEVVKAAQGKCVKVILETCLLSNTEIISACEISERAGANFVKTSTGFNVLGAKIEDVKLMKNTVGNKLEVKASGGIRDLKTAREMLDAGATRLGVSAGVQIMEELKNEY